MADEPERSVDAFMGVAIVSGAVSGALNLFDLLSDLFAFRVSKIVGHALDSYEAILSPLTLTFSHSYGPDLAPTVAMTISLCGAIIAKSLIDTRLRRETIEFERLRDHPIVHHLAIRVVELLFFLLALITVHVLTLSLPLLGWLFIFAIVYLTLLGMSLVLNGEWRNEGDLADFHRHVGLMGWGAVTLVPFILALNAYG